MPARPLSHPRLASRNAVRNPRTVRPAAAYRRRGQLVQSSDFSAPETWHEPRSRSAAEYIVEPPGTGYIHPVTPDEIRARLSRLPQELTAPLEVVKLSTLTRKRRLFPCYGMQWGPNIYLYPIEASLVEWFIRPPLPQQVIEARMFGGVWSEQDGRWRLTWTEAAIKDFYLNNVLIHELGHIHDRRNTRTVDRERFAIWFATEYGYRQDRGRC